MTDDEILAEFRAAEALLEGHFILSSGLRSPRYLQCARVLMDPKRASRLAEALAAKLPGDVRASRSMRSSRRRWAGSSSATKWAAHWACRRCSSSGPRACSGCAAASGSSPGTRVLMVEDVVTTGLSSREAIAAIEAAGGKVVAAASLVDRSGGSVDLGVPFTPLIRIDVPTYAAARPSARARRHPGDQAGQPRRVSRPLRLGVNIDHVATIRNARGGPHPDPLRAAEAAAAAGADGITAHLREDRRHITDADIDRLMAEIALPLNLEMAATEEMLAIALAHRPHAACIVPEKREERTTEGGLDAAGQFDMLQARSSSGSARRGSASACSSSRANARSTPRCGSARRWSSFTPGALPMSRRERRPNSSASPTPPRSPPRTASSPMPGTG